MKLEQLFLKKEELPILYKNCFQIPIHPKLLDENIKIDETIAKRIFPRAAKEWYEDLKNYSPEINQEKEWIEKVYLKQNPKIIKKGDDQYFNTWKDEVLHLDNGFVSSFCIDRDFGGTLYFLKNDRNCISVPPHKFSEEKKKEFMNSEGGIFVYAQHNVNAYPGALFLRNWAILYMNEVFKQIFS